MCSTTSVVSCDERKEKDIPALVCLSVSVCVSGWVLVEPCSRGFVSSRRERERERERRRTAIFEATTTNGTNGTHEWAAIFNRSRRGRYQKRRMSETTEERERMTSNQRGKQRKKEKGARITTTAIVSIIIMGGSLSPYAVRLTSCAGSGGGGVLMPFCASFLLFFVCPSSSSFTLRSFLPLLPSSPPLIHLVPCVHAYALIVHDASTDLLSVFSLLQPHSLCPLSLSYSLSLSLALALSLASSLAV